ncbi:MAG TPA: TIM barrel protein [Streptosporangiaceae bacterium]|nr:TIM barrel protein [Streptosporangiaceae bacterium]
MTTEQRMLALEHLTLLDVAPPEFVTLAAEAGFGAAGLRIAAAAPGERPWPMTPGSHMLADTVRRCRDTGTVVLDVEALRIGPEGAPPGYEAVLETAAELGARHLNVIGDDPDLSRLADHVRQLTPAALSYGVRPVIEFMAYKPVRSLADAVAIAERSAGGGILLDALHVQRCGIDLAQLAGVNPGLLTYLQICDAPRRAPHGLPVPDRLPRGQPPDRGDGPLEARTRRLLPGEGELPLAELLAAVPGDMPVAVEAPHLALAGELGPRAFAARARRALGAVLSAPAVPQKGGPPCRLG